MIERRNISVEKLSIDPVQSRDKAWKGDETDQKLANSITKTGVLQDIIVRPKTRIENRSNDQTANEYTVVAGSRRYYAAMDAGDETVPCKIIEATDLDAAWKSLQENTDRRELSEQEIANQLQLIYNLIKPREEPERCPCCGKEVEGEAGLLQHTNQTECSLPRDKVGNLDQSVEVSNPDERFVTERGAYRYLAERYLGRTDKDAIRLIKGHLRTAELPPVLQSLFKTPGDRTTQEKTTLKNYGIDKNTRLGSGEGKSGTSSEIVKLHNAVEEQVETDSLSPETAVLETVGSLHLDGMSEQELRRTLRDFRHEVTAELNKADGSFNEDRKFRDVLQRTAMDLRESYTEVESKRPFKRVDVLGPDTQKHSRWHVQEMQRRDVSGHGELVRELYTERLEELAEQEGWG